MATSFAVSVRRAGDRLALDRSRGCDRGAARTCHAGSYGWPLKPFDQQHPVRGFFGDPRIGEAADGHIESKTFHFGIDISAPDGTAVYASASGRIVWEPQRPETIAIRADDGTRLRLLAHRPGRPQRRVRRRLPDAARPHLARSWGHVHFAELVDGRYVNPLRRGAMTPYEDTTRPTVHAFSFERDGKSRRRRASSAGRFDLVGGAWDDTPLRVPGKWARQAGHAAVVRWRIRGEHGAQATPWRTAIDFTSTIPPPSMLRRAVRAVDTPEPCRGEPAAIGCRLARDWDSRALRDGRHTLEVEAIDTRGNATRRRRFDSELSPAVASPATELS